MIPVRLRLRNFLSYGEPDQTLHFDGFHLACLCGDNGHGKSAILDAITWALWGSARGSGRRDLGDDDLIQLGQTEMEVEFEFDLTGNRYVVLRKRSIRRTAKRQTGTSVLELQIVDDGRYRPLTGDTLSETQRKINELLRIDYETFINSAFILQGRADEFTRKTASERKTILADLLGLSLYDRLTERARNEARRVELDLRAVEVEIQQIDGELKREPEYQDRLTHAMQAVAMLSSTVATLEARLDQLRDRKRALDTKAEHLDMLRERTRRAEQEVHELQQRIANQQKLIGEIEAVLTRRDEIVRGASELEQARRAERDLAAKMSEFLALNTRKASVEKAIAEARLKLDAQRNLLARQAAELRQAMDRLPQIERELANAQHEQARLVAITTERDELRQAIQQFTLQAEELRRTNERLRTEGNEIKRRLELLDKAGATCPICESPLDDVGHRRLRDRFDAEFKQLGAEYHQNQERIRECERQAEGLKKRLAECDALLKRKNDVDRRVAALQQQVDAAQTARERLVETESERLALETRLAEEQFASEQRADLDAITRALATLGYAPEEHQRLRRRCDELSHFEQKLRELETAESRLPEERARLDEFERAATERQRELADLRQLAKLLEAELDEREGVAREIRVVESELDDRSAQLSNALTERGRAQQLVDTCNYYRQERAKKEADRAKLAGEKSIFDDLVVAFGKKGIQAMIIESAIPEIEREANDLLARMTDNRMHLTFETQREGTGGNVIETLVIKVSDELGVRPLELFSGGEAFRVNFAVRVALSKLLARRAGTRLQTLVVDEGFGTQDSVGRQRLVEAINAIRDDFAKVLVVTHLDEIKDAFPTRIEIFKGPDGSRISVN